MNLTLLTDPQLDRVMSAILEMSACLDLLGQTGAVTEESDFDTLMNSAIEESKRRSPALPPTFASDVITALNKINGEHGRTPMFPPFGQGWDHPLATNTITQEQSQ